MKGHRRITTLELKPLSFCGSVQDAARQVDLALERAIDRNLPSSGRAGVALSGGVDSIYLLAKVRQLTGAGRLQSFTFGYGSDDPQMKRASEVAARYGTEHHETVVLVEELEELLAISVRYLEEPVGRDHFPSLIKMALMAAGKADVLLFGNGIEQSFTGEAVHRRVDFVERYPMLRGALEDLATEDYSGTAPRTKMGRVLISGKRVFHGTTPPAPHVLGVKGVNDRINLLYPAPALANFMRIDLARAKGHFRVKFAALADLAKIQMRTPFYDASIINLGLGMPATFKLRYGEGKFIFRRAACRVLPRHEARIPKGVSRLRHNDRFWDVLLEMASRYASDDIVRSRGLFDPEEIRLLREGATRKRRTMRWLYRLWYQVALEMWMQAFIDR
jgi:asparagine synthase (glutamine-hydrolysing)